MNNLKILKSKLTHALGDLDVIDTRAEGWDTILLYVGSREELLDKIEKLKEEIKALEK